MEKELDLIVKKYMSMDYFPSAVVKVFNDKDVLYNKAFGDAKINTIFDVASLSKIVTSTIILSLINEGKLNLNSRIGDIMPFLSYFNGLKERCIDITIEQLLIHNSGLIDWYPFYSEEGIFFEVLDKVVKQYDKIRGTLYSDLNFMLLGEIIKYVTNKSLEECLIDYVKIPLGIKNICYNPVDKENIAPSSYGNIIEERMCKERNIYYENWRDQEKELIGEVNDGNSYYFFKGVAGHAGVFADVDAYCRICQMYLLSQDELLLKSMQDYGSGRGLGWQVAEMYPYGCGHTGFTGTSLWVSKEKNLGAVILTNRLMGNWKESNLNLFRTEIHKCIVKYF